jgi:hypothetical protein
MTDPREMRKGAAAFALFSLVFVGAGAMMALMAYDYIPHGRMYVPAWLGAVVGAAFLLPGLCMLGMAIQGLIAPASMERGASAPYLWAGVLVALTLTCMALVCGGVALFGDPRGFYGGIPGIVIDKRIAFMLAALLVGALAAYFWLLLIVRASSSGKR